MLLAPSFLAISLVRMVDALIVMDAAATTTSACCPTCGTRSTEIHDRYQRHPADLPWRGYRVQLALLVRRFRCLNPACSRATFAEGLGSALRPYARRTADAEALLLLMAHTSGAEAGARLAAQAGLPASADTLLRLLRRGATVAGPAPRVLSIDDLALRRGRRYATLFVALETRRPIDLLEGREAALTLPWSQGTIEGHIHRVKLLKRQGYGRATLDLLRCRVLAS